MRQIKTKLFIQLNIFQTISLKKIAAQQGQDQLSSYPEGSGRDSLECGHQ